MEESPICCLRGFHFCPKLKDIFKFYPANPYLTRVGIVRIEGDVDTSIDGIQASTNALTLVCELSWNEVFKLYEDDGYCLGEGNIGHHNIGNSNIGHDNDGHKNIGHYNSGDKNILSNNVGNANNGCHNFGSQNVGDYNYLDTNRGTHNLGHRNVGSNNKGNDNIGVCNFGDSNIGLNNRGDFVIGAFCTKPSTIKLFNKESNLTFEQLQKHPAYLLLQDRFKLTEWIPAKDMTKEEKRHNLTFIFTKGYLKTYTYEQAWQNLWLTLSDSEKQIILGLPNFDKVIFETCTGIKFD